MPRCIRGIVESLGGAASRLRTGSLPRVLAPTRGSPYDDRVIRTDGWRVEALVEAAESESNGTIEQDAAALRAAIAAAADGLVDRAHLVELVALGAVAREHVLVVGPPGTAKSEAARRIARALGGRYFEYLLGRFTEPGEIFGPIDIRRLAEGILEARTEGMLPEAEIAFLDEVFLGSTAILNTLLALLNERTFRRGQTVIDAPLRVCVGATNVLPEDETLAAFADRFLIRVFLSAVSDPDLETLLESGWRLGGLDRDAARDGSSLHRIEALDRLATAARAIDLAPIRGELAHAVRLLRRAGVALSDRRLVRSQALIAAAAVLAGRTRAAAAADLWPLVYAVPSEEGQALARETLRDVLATAASPSLPTAAELAAHGPAARAARLVAEGEALLSTRPVTAEAVGAWLLRIEGVGREIDAGFAPSALPESLAHVRARLAAALDERGETAPSPASP